MNKDEMIDLLQAYEWREVEFKEARSKVPKSVYETVSAFANTAGGHLVFGVRKKGAGYEILGVLNVDNVQNDFISTLKPPKISKAILVQEYMHSEGDDVMLIFYVPESPRIDKPIFLDGDIRRSFIRKGGCDVRCSPEEMRRFINDATADRFDTQPLDFDISKCFDESSVKWYRYMYDARPGNKSHAGLSNEEFFYQLGLLIDRNGVRVPTRAAILLFGTDAVVRDILPRPVVDCQRYKTNVDAPYTGQRWVDRLIIEENLTYAWRKLLDWYMKLTENPFKIDPVTLQRNDEPPDYVSFRESIINLLIHQDYSDHTRKPVIKHYLDRSELWNPGDAFAENFDLLEPGEKEVRNPRIVSAFRRIGLSENAGWGLREVFRNWQQLGNVPPQIVNDKARKTFSLTLLKEKLLSDEQMLFQSKIGVHLDEQETRVFAYACRKTQVTLTEIRTLTGLGGADALKIIDRLCVQKLLMPVKKGEIYAIEDYLRDRFYREKGRDSSEVGDLYIDDLRNAQVVKQRDAVYNVQPPEFIEASPAVRVVGGKSEPESVQVASGAKGALRDLCTFAGEPLKFLNETQWKIVFLCEVPRTLADIMEAVGVSHRGYFKNNYLNPVIEGGVVRMTNPERPRASNQKYVLTHNGLRLLLSRKEGLQS